MACPECGGEIESSTYVDYCIKCDWAYGYPSLWNGIGTNYRKTDEEVY